MAILHLAAIKLIERYVDDLFDRARVRYLGPQSLDKRIVAGFKSDLSLPGIFMGAAREEGAVPDKDVLAALLRNAGNYLDAYRNQTKAQVVKKVTAFLTQAELGGVKTDLATVLGGELADVWKKTTNDVTRLIDTEASNARNMGTLEGIVAVNAAEGIEDPVVYFVVVRDQHLCDECKRLHLLDDEITPRVYFLSELGHGYHKKGQDDPKVGGLHPHCRCTMVTLLPGYGFGKDGMVKFVNLDHDELQAQRGLNKAEEPLEKGFKQHQLKGLMKPYGWTEKQGGGHDMLEHPQLGAKIPFQRGYSGDYDLQWVKHHLNQAGLMLDKRGRGAVPDPSHAYYPHYVKMGHATPAQAEPAVKTWSVPGAEPHPIEALDLGDAFDGRAHAEAMQALKTGRTQNLPPVHIMDLGGGRYGTLDNHHLLQAARDAGMTHVPTVLVKSTAPSRKPRQKVPPAT